jgi:ankyrin repeat protein
MAVVQQLIEAGAQTDLTDEIGGTPMSYALLSGQTAIVELLLKKRPKTGLDDTISGDLLLSAAQKGHNDVVKLLLDSGKVNPNLKNKSGRTPLSLAAENSHDAVLELLLDCSEVDANLKDGTGRTPLSWATGSVVAHMLLNFSKINANFERRLWPNAAIVGYPER